jgi:Trp operon repressor
MQKRAGIGIEPPPDIVAAVQRLVEECETERAVAQKLGIGSATLTRLRAGLTVRAGTIALVRERLRASA